MTTAPATTSPPLLSRDRLVVLAGLTGITLASWSYMFYDARRNSTGVMACCLPEFHHWTTTDVVMLFVMWAVMMIAMMVPSVSPTILMFAAVNRQRHAEHRPYVPTFVFLGGYLLAWTAFSAVATLLQWALHSLALVSGDMVATSPWLGSGILIAAGIFQFTPMKSACLKHCQTPLSFILTGWKDGIAGALVMGWSLGIHCAICCWLLMLILFVTGVMNLLWVGIITAFVLLEKLTPRNFPLPKLAGTAMILWGVGILAHALLAR